MNNAIIKALTASLLMYSFISGCQGYDTDTGEPDYPYSCSCEEYADNYYMCYVGGAEAPEEAIEDCESRLDNGDATMEQALGKCDCDINTVDETECDDYYECSH